MRLFGKKEKMDERERLELYTIEHYMYWVTFWGLLVSIFWQQIMMEAHFVQYAGEWIVFMVMALGSVIAEARKGHYDNYSQPGWRSYLAYSVVFTIIFTALILLNGWMRGWYRGLGDILLVGGLTAAFLLALTYGALACVGSFVKRRRKKLEEKLEEEDEER